ncbi:uncharacterized protein LOC109908312 isoform X1 [Oncorhynchus kisutch]|uniref:uncharacterized protein LOC109908312 isoform X1 n=1 Tax=Oncorhynchus kisutch TaxID=8019 RepID=UPI0009A055A7|nr:uncharacterized protein LOC109908312 isoform X1 [Oncorhynchus kisutch]
MCYDVENPPTFLQPIGLAQIPSYHLINRGGLDLSLSSWISSLHCRSYSRLSSLQNAPGHTRGVTEYYHFDRKTGGGKKMRSGILLVALFVAMKLHSSQSSCEEHAHRSTDSEEGPGLGNIQRTILKRYNGLDYDSFVGLMGRRGADINDLPPSPHKREMDDVFVGLMGRRNSELGFGTGIDIGHTADIGNMRPLRKEVYPETRKGGLFFNKCRLRFRRGL